MYETYLKVCRTTAVYVGVSVSISFTHVVAISVFIIWSDLCCYLGYVCVICKIVVKCSS